MQYFLRVFTVCTGCSFFPPKLHTYIIKIYREGSEALVMHFFLLGGVSGQDVSKYGEVRKGLQSGQSQLKVANLLALAEVPDNLAEPRPVFN